MFIKAKTIAEAWWQAMHRLYNNSYEVPIQRGSFAKAEIRHQLEWISGEIEYPLYDIVPQVPPGVPQPTTMDYIEEYFNEKLISTERGEGEEYTYAERILEQLPQVVEILRNTPFTNQAVIEVAKSIDLVLPDPPCLRTITLKVLPGKILNMAVFFRSWDLYAGFPTNLGGLALLQQFIAGFLEDTKVGKLFFASDGAHCYSYSWEYVRQIVKRA